MKAQLISHCYGKARVRVLKVHREGATHTLKELEVSVALEGDFASSYTEGDNALVVATDTMKNTVNVLAQRHLGAETEPFVMLVARHFVAKYPQVRQATVEAVERPWEPLSGHSFVAAGRSQPFARAEVTAGVEKLSSGLREMLILKSSGSGFSGFPRDEFTTLPETEDRIFCTALSATWHWTAEPDSYAAANAAILQAMLQPFTTEFSPSVQTTLFQMGEAALAAVEAISLIALSMPNKHCLLISLSQFGLANPNELFLPTDEPHGLIEATVGRG